MQLCIWTLTSGDAAIISVDAPLHTIQVTADGRTAVGCSATQLYICDPTQGVLLRCVPVPQSTNLVLSPDGDYVAVACRRVPGMRLTVWRIVTTKTI